jgi:hypothetical protein
MDENIDLKTPSPPKASKSLSSKSFGNEYMYLLKDASKNFIETFSTLNNDDKLKLLDSFMNNFPEISHREICNMIDNAINNKHILS